MSTKYVGIGAAPAKVGERGGARHDLHTIDRPTDRPTDQTGWCGKCMNDVGSVSVSVNVQQTSVK